jgi:hypothetical protein
MAEKVAEARAGQTSLCRKPFDSGKEAMMTVPSQERQVRRSNVAATQAFATELVS